MLSCCLAKWFARPTAEPGRRRDAVPEAGAALTLFDPVTAFVSSLNLGIRREVYPLVGAVLGYFIKR
jgi:hypothetical protein